MPELSPVTAGTDVLRVLEDWGLATYREDWEDPASSFLSLRAGAPAGTTLYDYLLAAPVDPDPLPDVELTWANANTHHEHPDNGSFTFYPHGKRFITGLDRMDPDPLLTRHENTYTFVLNDPADCFDEHGPPPQLPNPIDFGQQGEGYGFGTQAWPNWQGSIQTEDSRGVLARAAASQGVAFAAVEIAGAYADCLQIDRLYRNFVLLPEGVLLLLDSVANSGSTAAAVLNFNHLTGPQTVYEAPDYNDPHFPDPHVPGFLADSEGLGFQTAEGFFRIDALAPADLVPAARPIDENWDGTPFHSATLTDFAPPSDQSYAVALYFDDPDEVVALGPAGIVVDPAGNGITLQIDVGPAAAPIRYTVEVSRASDTATRTAFFGADLYGRVSSDAGLAVEF